MAERIREVPSGSVTEEYLRRKTEEGWKIVAIEWERETDEKSESAWFRKEVPYGLRVSDDCRHLEDNPVERRALERMLDLIARDQSVSEVAEELNRAGFRTRRGTLWSRTAVFEMLPRLIEAAPDIRRVPAPVER
jgi:hypothetical protein